MDIAPAYFFSSYIIPTELVFVIFGGSRTRYSISVGLSFYEKHLVDDQVLFNLSKLNRLIEFSCSFSAGVLLAHALEDVMLTH